MGAAFAIDWPGDRFIPGVVHPDRRFRGDRRSPRSYAAFVPPCAPPAIVRQPAFWARPYVFFIPYPLLPNRSLTRGADKPVSVSTGEPDMSDLVYIALGSGALFVLALYARALDRL
ncbi:hypothetical protein [Rhizobium sp. TRM95796]|uniref:hypothetical protein n=1 Tax=Rhizobium sp. TRM95796 TaxID=2979862 RepID=UPI0021E6FCC9|nr:hypothetical protein [Rhizobium sp. TRM95796]MCV3764728.1 hypothetical protein [Rhizobium sp. TRM95796]